MVRRERRRLRDDGPRADPHLAALASPAGVSSAFSTPSLADGCRAEAAAIAWVNDFIVIWPENAAIFALRSSSSLMFGI
jgi:hypothetical protein